MKRDDLLEQDDLLKLLVFLNRLKMTTAMAHTLFGPDWEDDTKERSDG